jgi:hypothetical protein
MQSPSQVSLQRLCNKAANEQDPDKLLELVREINRLFEEKSDGIAETADQEKAVSGVALRPCSKGSSQL